VFQSAFVGDVRERVVGDHHVRAHAVRDQIPGEGPGEERLARRDPGGPGGPGGARGGIDPEHADAGPREVLQQVTVVARDLDREAPGAQAARLDDLLRVFEADWHAQGLDGEDVLALAHDALHPGGASDRVDRLDRIGRVTPQFVAQEKLISSEHYHAEREREQVVSGSRNLGKPIGHMFRVDRREQHQ